MKGDAGIISSARHTEILITYNGSDITKDLRPYLTSFTFTDNAGGKADDISLTLQDARGEWLRDWMPAKSDTITASILTSAQSLPCGSFSVDQADYSMPPRTLTIKGVSTSIKKSAAVQQKTRAWEETTLKQIISSIASQNGLALFMDIAGDYVIKRSDQIEQSDLDYLHALCSDYGVSVKVHNDTLTVYTTENYENASPSIEIESTDKRIITWRFTSKSAKVYRKARLRYHDPVKNEDYDEEIEDAAEEGSERVLEILERAESQEDAKRIAEQRLIEANRKEITGTITLTGDTRFAAGITVMLSGFGMFSGKHFVNKVTHKVDSSGYTTSIELGQPQAEKGKAHSRKSVRKKTGGTSGELFYEGEHYYR